MQRRKIKESSSFIFPVNVIINLTKLDKLNTGLIVAVVSEKK